MVGTPASCHPRPRRRGRPRTADIDRWELDIRALEMREAFEKAGPSLRAIARCHPREASYLGSLLARQVTRDYHRRQ